MRFRVQSLTFSLLLCLLPLLASPVHAADTLARGYEETFSQNHNGIGLSVGVGGLNGVAYRHYWGNIAMQINVLPLVAEGGKYVAVFGGVQLIDYLLMWNRAARSTIFPATSALRVVASTGLKLSRDQTDAVSVPTANCQSPECQAINHQSAPLHYFAHVGLGLGVELGAIARSGLSIAIDLQMHVMWDEFGFWGLFPIPSAAFMYSW